MEELKEMHCDPVKKGTAPLQEPEIKRLLGRLKTPWKLINDTRIRKEFPFENFKRGMAFAQELALLAEQENHHPDICIYFTNVVVELSTHDIGGLSENDFIMAAKIDSI
jgi:4a-hydroxytetrahydrobiopterin dehydratase